MIDYGWIIIKALEKWSQADETSIPWLKRRFDFYHQPLTIRKNDYHNCKHNNRAVTLSYDATNMLSCQYLKIKIKIVTVDFFFF